jgi:7-keto-8-aminopelargonate synthetase-like enzyme
MSAADRLRGLSPERKRELLRRALEQKHAAAAAPDNLPDFTKPSFDMFLMGSDPGLSEVRGFNAWLEATAAAGSYTFETPRREAQRPTNVIVRENGDELPVINTASYNYLGYGYHPDVIAAAKEALDRFGLGVASSPIAGGTIQLHRELEEKLVEFMAVPGNGASLFSSGYAVNSGTISALVKPGGHVVLDRAAHMSIVEGAQLSRADVRYFEHNDVDHLDEVLRDIRQASAGRILVCAEGVYSSDGDYGDLRGISSAAKRHNAMVLVDEAHSILVAGPRGRGVAAQQGVLEDIDLFVITFSKGFGGIGGAVLARQDIVRYVNWYARCRMFSCALDPAVTGGLIRALELAQTPDADRRRARVMANARFLRERLRGKVTMVESDSWIVPVIYGSDRLTLLLTDYMQRAGLETSIVQYPAVPRELSRMRLFVTSEHTEEQLARAAEILLEAADRFGFAT